MTPAPPADPGEEATWRSWNEIPRCVCHPPHLRRTAAIALAVGLLLFLVNQLDVVLDGRATLATGLKVCLDVVIPFCVSNLGVLTAARRPGAGDEPGTPRR